jgi:hypothetical protein
LRRLVHIALLLTIMIGIRACGGLAHTEDRLGATTRWMAEKVGLGNAKDSFDARVRPPMAAATRSIGDAIYATASQTMDQVEMAASNFGGWMTQQARAALGMVDSAVPVVDANQADQRSVRERQDSEDEAQQRDAPQRRGR